MLGPLTHAGGFLWTAVGKHPAAMDYIHLASGSSLLDAVADWMTKGYDQLNRRTPLVQGQHSFRFWLRGASKGTLLFGLGRDSSDRIGRPYPFFIMGEGALKGWEQTWDDMPLRLDQCWQHMEAIAAGRYDDVKALTAALGRLSGPAQAQRRSPAVARESAPLTAACRDELERTGRTLIDLGAVQDDPAAAVRQRLAGVKEWISEPPLAFFLGGTPQRSCLAVIRTALNAEDFSRLWSI